MNIIQQTEPNKIAIILSFFAIYFIWGSTYLANAIGVETVPPYLWAAARFIVAGGLILSIRLLFGHSIKIPRIQLKNTFIAGLLFLTIGNGFMCWALQFLDSGFMSLLVALQPLILILMIWVLQSKRPQIMSVIGTMLGLLGMYLLVSQSVLVQSDNQIIGVLLCFICLLAWGYASLFVADADIPESPFLNTGYQMIFGGILLFILSLAMGESPAVLFSMDLITSGSLIYLIIFGSIAAFTAFNYLLRHVSPEKVATSTYVNPIVAVALGWWLRDELITSQTLIAAAILFSGVYFINTARFSKKAEPQD